jgi:DNA ligase (NAD+)
MITLESLDVESKTPEEIGEILIEAKKAYYTGSRPIMDDHTYDTLEAILRQKAPFHRLFSKVGAPNFDTGWTKKQHTLPMNSQNKVSQFKDLVHYFELKKLPPHTQFVVQPKCDGLSLEIEYKNGQLVDAITRGDGIIGDVITQNVVKMKNFVKHPEGFSGSVRCEIVVTSQDFQKLNQVADELYSNPRNAASGLSQRLDSRYSEYCTLMAVDMLPEPLTESQKISALKQLGFNPVETYTCNDFQEIETIYQRFLVSNRKNYPFEIDGLVVKIDDLVLSSEIGSKNNRPKYQVAYKFPASTNETQIKNVVWQVGPMGSITPVAEVEPIELSGAIITFASLGNYDLVIQKDINIGDIVKISRRGDVIPHIEKVITKVSTGHVQIPVHCPYCHTSVVTEDKFLRCPNTTGCLPQIIGSLVLFCDTLEIKGLSFKTIEKLYEAGRIKLPGDFFKLESKDIADLENLGEKSAKNIIHQIQSKKDLTLKQIFDAAIIPNFSAQRIQQLINSGFDQPEKLLNITENQLENLPGFQKTLAGKVWQGINARKSWIESIISQVSIKQEVVSNALSGLVFCITGELSVPRPEIIKNIESRGGKVASSVSSHTSYLVTNESDSTSSKFVTAKKLGVPIINESKLFELLK